MARCMICGKRIWSDLVSLPGKGTYHYDCAKKTGVLPSLEAVREEVSKLLNEIKSEADILAKMRAEGASRRGASADLRRLHDKVKHLDALQAIYVRRRMEMLEEKKGV